ncbi:MAG: hypothetical protein AAFQ35_04245 [Pseudomonadota bacterium]
MIMRTRRTAPARQAYARRAVAAGALMLGCVTSVSANDQIPTLEDAGYAFEATLNCPAMALSEAATRRLQRARRFRRGRRIFRDAAKRWGETWACRVAQENLGTEIDLSDFASGRLVVQPPPSELPPPPVRKPDTPPVPALDSDAAIAAGD